MVFTKLSGASGLFVDSAFVYVQAFGVEPWNHRVGTVLLEALGSWLVVYWSTVFACVALLRFQRDMPPW